MRNSSERVSLDNNAIFIARKKARLREEIVTPFFPID